MRKINRKPIRIEPTECNVRDIGSIAAMARKHGGNLLGVEARKVRVLPWALPFPDGSIVVLVEPEEDHKASGTGAKGSEG